MADEEFKPKQEVENLAEKRTEALSDDEIDAKEQEQLSQIGKRIRDFLLPKKDEDERQREKREWAVRYAIADVAEESKISEVIIYKLIWPQDKDALQMLGGRGMVDNYEDIQKYISPDVRQEFWNTTAQKHPYFILRSGFSAVNKEQYADEVFQIALKNIKESALGDVSNEALTLLAGKPFAGDFLKKVAKAQPGPVAGLFHSYEGFPHAMEVFRIAVVQDKDPLGFYHGVLRAMKKYKHNAECVKIVLKTNYQSSPLSTLVAIVSNDIGTDEYSDIIVQTLDSALSKDPGSLLRQFKNGLDKKLKPEVYKTYLEKSVRSVEESRPTSLLEFLPLFGKESYAKEILLHVVHTNPQYVVENAALLKGFPYEKEILKEANALVESVKNVRSKMDFNKRKDVLHEFIASRLQGYEKALEIVNNELGVKLECMGIQNKPLRLVFINTFSGKSSLPVRIDISYRELLNMKQESQMSDLLIERFQEQLANIPDKQSTENTTSESRSSTRSVTRPRFEPAFYQGSQIQLWQKDLDFDLHKGKTSVMLVMVPGSLSGVEQDYADKMAVYQTRYGATIRSVNVENKKDWETAINGRGIKDLPKPSEATEKSILDSLDESLESAVKNGDTLFLLDYMAHGGGGSGSRSGPFTYGSIKVQNEGVIDVEDFAKHISREVDGKPLCSQISIGIIAESCFSGPQLKKIRDYLKTQGVKVKNLYVISESNLTPSTGSFGASNAALINERKRKRGGGAMAYYIDYYFQMIDFKKSQGHSIQPPTGTFGHAIRFADLMAREDSTYKQDSRGYQYSTEKNIDNFFSATESPSTENIS